VTANENLGYGANIQNQTATTPADVIFTGSSMFNENGSTGLDIASIGKVTLNNITANENSGGGLRIDNNDSGTSSVTLTGTNRFYDNALNGATIESNGSVSVTRITADDNLFQGLAVDTLGAVAITCGSFNHNGQYGWYVGMASSLLTLNGVSTAGNGIGPSSNSAVVTVTNPACPLP
jgi:hypothetical protein